MAIVREVSSASAGEPDVQQRTERGRPIHIRTTHVGQVVDIGQTYLYDGDYTYWAVVANTDGSFEQVHYGSTYPGYGHAEVDAPPAKIAAWQTEKERREAEARRQREERIAAQELYEAKLRARTPRFGSMVRVVKGRKVPIGAEGRVFWAGDNGVWGPRIGIEFTDGSREFISAGNVEVLTQTVP